MTSSIKNHPRNWWAWVR